MDQKWDNDIYLTFDMDWASDEVIEYTCDLLIKANIKATFFVTHETKFIYELRKNNLFELGIHPNFNGLMELKEIRSYTKIIDDLLELVPEAVSTRSHALFNSSLIVKYMAGKGIKYDLNTYIPIDAGMDLKPYKYFFDTIKLPHFYEDDVYFSDKNKPLPEVYLDKKNCIKVFDFHPIHIFLNTETALRYESARSSFYEYKELIKYVCDNKKIGTRSFFHNLINLAKQRKYEFKHISEINL